MLTLDGSVTIRLEVHGVAKVKIEVVFHVPVHKEERSFCSRLDLPLGMHSHLKLCGKVHVRSVEQLLVVDMVLPVWGVRCELSSSLDSLLQQRVKGAKRNKDRATLI
jgi:hypothetical protein